MNNMNIKEKERIAWLRAVYSGMEDTVSEYALMYPEYAFAAEDESPEPLEEEIIDEPRGNGNEVLMILAGLGLIAAGTLWK